jgi:hypothetical protein
VDICAEYLRRMGRRVFWCVFLGLALNVAEPRLCAWSLSHHYPYAKCPGGGIFLGLALVAVALITFFGFLAFGTDIADMRTAITIAIVTVYLVMVSLVAFFSLVPTQDVHYELNPLTKTMITSFTAIVAVVIPSYFGATAYVQARPPRATRVEEGNRDEERRNPNAQRELPGDEEELERAEEPRPDVSGVQEGVRRPWWRRVFGG